MVDEEPVVRETRLPPPPDVVARAKERLIEIQPWYWEFGSEVYNFYRETEKKMQQKGTNIALLLGDVRCGKTVERVKWEAEKPDRVVGCNLEGHGNSTDRQIIDDILVTIGEKKPEVLILDEVGYVKDRFQNVIDELTTRLPGIKIMAVLPLRLDEGNEVVQELEEFVESKKGLVENFPATWHEDEIARYFRRRCEMAGFSFDEEVQDQTILAIHYLCLGIPKSVEIATTELLTFLASRKGVAPGKISKILSLGLAYYINTELEMEVPEEAGQAAGCFSNISDTLYELVLKDMPDRRYQQRKSQQERLGAWYMLHSSLEKMGIPVKKPDYDSVPIHVHPTEEVFPPVDVEAVVGEVLESVLRGQSVSLTRISPEDKQEIIRQVIDQMKQPAIRLNMARILNQAPAEAQTLEERKQIAQQLALDLGKVDSPATVKKALKKAGVSLIIFEGVEECIENQWPLYSATNGSLRTLLSEIPAISLANLARLRYLKGEGSPLFNVFDDILGDYFRKT